MNRVLPSLYLKVKDTSQSGLPLLQTAGHVVQMKSTLMSPSTPLQGMGASALYSRELGASRTAHSCQYWRSNEECSCSMGT